MSYSNVIDCAIRNWYPKFKKITFESLFIDIDTDFLTYLNEDGIHIPEKNEKPQKLLKFIDKVEKAIEKLGGEVIPKFTWSVPRDAAWMKTGQTTKCTDATDVLVLLKSSNQITHDLDHAFDECNEEDFHENNDHMKENNFSHNQPEKAKKHNYTNKKNSDHNPKISIKPKTFTDHSLCLRRWHELNPGQEFRCFIKSNKLIAISQRHTNFYHSWLEAKLNSYRDSIEKFFTTKIMGNFSCSNHIMDIYIKDNGGILLVDFNVYNPSTHPLLFTYEELEEIHKTITVGMDINTSDIQKESHPPIYKTISNNLPPVYNTKNNRPTNNIYLPSGNVSTLKTGALPNNSITSPFQNIIDKNLSLNNIDPTTNNIEATNTVPTSNSNSTIPFRIIQSESTIQSNIYGWDAYPEDLLHITKGLDMDKFNDLVKMDIQKFDEDEEDDDGYDDDDRYED